jgi:hypothetical protein
MARLISNEFYKYFDGLAATNAICVALGTTFTKGTNLFVDVEPANATQMVTSISYGGGPPDTDKYKYLAGVQVRVKANSIQKSLETNQAIINTLHMNHNICASTNGVVYADQSAPFLLEIVNSGQYYVSISNYTVRYIKLT